MVALFSCLTPFLLLLLVFGCQSCKCICYESLFLLQVAAIQISPSQLTIENFATDYCHDLKTDIHIKGVYMVKVRLACLYLSLELQTTKRTECKDYFHIGISFVSLMFKLFQDHVIVWDGKRVVVYEVSSDMAMVRAAGKCDSII